MRAIFTDPANLGLLAGVALGAVVSCLIAFALLGWLNRRMAGDGKAVPVAPYFSAVTLIWALMFGFVSSEVWSDSTRAIDVAQQERSTLQRLVGMADPAALDLPDLLEALTHYATAVREREWGAGGNNRAALAEVDAAVQDIRLSLLRADAAGVSDALMGKMIQDFDELQDARNARLAIGMSEIRDVKWMLVIALALLSQVAIVFVHRDKVRAGRTAVIIFTAGAAVSIWLVALYASPYVGGLRLSEATLAGVV